MPTTLADIARARDELGQALRDVRLVERELRPFEGDPPAPLLQRRQEAQERAARATERLSRLTGARKR